MDGKGGRGDAVGIIEFFQTSQLSSGNANILVDPRQR
jgi:hypothetical protein